MDCREETLNALAVISMAGVAGEGLSFEDIQGQSADLFTLQKMMNRSAKKLSAGEQQVRTGFFFLLTGGKG